MEANMLVIIINKVPPRKRDGNKKKKKKNKLAVTTVSQSVEWSWPMHRIVSLSSDYALLIDIAIKYVKNILSIYINPGQTAAREPHAYTF